MLVLIGVAPHHSVQSVRVAEDVASPAFGLRDLLVVQSGGVTAKMHLMTTTVLL